MIFNQIIKYDFSVRKVEEIVRELNNQDNKELKKIKRTNFISPEEYKQLQKHLSSYFVTDVIFKRNPKGSGKIVIPFKNDGDLERIIAILDKMNI